MTAIQGLLTTHAAFLGESTVEGVSHYLEHDEFGISFWASIRGPQARPYPGPNWEEDEWPINGLMEWQAKLAGLRLVASKPVDEAEMNSLFFELSEVAEREVSSEDIADFLASCCRAFSEKE